MQHSINRPLILLLPQKEMIGNIWTLVQISLKEVSSNERCALLHTVQGTCVGTNYYQIWVSAVSAQSVKGPVKGPSRSRN